MGGLVVLVVLENRVVLNIESLCKSRERSLL